MDRNLTLAITTLSSPPVTGEPPRKVISAVVVSSSFHATILRDAEGLRKEMPGLERFKFAARRNVSRWYRGSVKLPPPGSTGVTLVYDPSVRGFVAHTESTLDSPIVNLQGPFIYFLSTVNVDCLEHSFRMTPLISKIPPTEASLDVVVVRPERDPRHTQDGTFEKKMWTVLQGAYQDGIHIDLRYRGDGEIVSEGNGPTVVDYFRCGGWEWAPDENDPDAHLLCFDGSISSIEKGGKAVCVATSAYDNTGCMVFT